VALTRDGIGGLACLAGSLVLLWSSRDIPQPALVPIGPAFYPRIVLAVTAVLSAALLASDLRRRRPATNPPRPRVNYRLVVLTFLVFTLYVFVLPLLGYRLGTVLFIAGLQATLDPPRNRRDWALVAVVAIVSMLVTYYLFERYLSVLLPRGRLTGF
jgi:putative tricarboxylic transport membrane protein